MYSSTAKMILWLLAILLASCVYFRRYLYVLYLYLKSVTLSHVVYGTLKRSDHKYILSYVDGLKTYTITFPMVRGPCKFYSVTAYGDGGAEDVTDAIREYAGPSHDFHTIPTSPFLLGYPALTFHYRGGESKTFCDKEIINHD